MEDFSKLYDTCASDEGQDTNGNCYRQLASIHDAFYRLKKDAETAYNVMDAMCEFAERSDDSAYNED